MLFTFCMVILSQKSLDCSYQFPWYSVIRCLLRWPYTNLGCSSCCAVPFSAPWVLAAQHVGSGKIWMGPQHSEIEAPVAVPAESSCTMCEHQKSKFNLGRVITSRVKSCQFHKLLLQDGSVIKVSEDWDFSDSPSCHDFPLGIQATSFPCGCPTSPVQKEREQHCLPHTFLLSCKPRL